jgi:hypothetical protein
MLWSAFNSTIMPSRLVRAAILAAVVGGLGSGLGGCANVGAVSDNVANAQASMAGPTGAPGTVAFESVDGPPPQVFDRLVGLLDSEARLRNLSVVSRQQGAAYHVRSYLSAQVRSGRNSIAWVWDVYDNNQQRALRLTGEEQTGSSGGDAWASADDLVLRRIAQAGLSGLSGMMNGTAPSEVAPGAPAVRGNGPAIASTSDASTRTLAFADDGARGTAR